MYVINTKIQISSLKNAAYIVVQEVLQDVAVLALPEQVGRHKLEGAGGVEAKAAHGDEEGDGHRDRQVHGEGEAEALDADLARELSCGREGGQCSERMGGRGLSQRSWRVHLALAPQVNLLKL